MCPRNTTLMGAVRSRRKGSRTKALELSSGAPGDFREVSGEATFDFSSFGAFGEFIATFDLEDAADDDSSD